MNIEPEVLQQVFQYLDKIGAKIGMTADMIWPWLVKQQYIEFGISAMILVTGLFLIPISLRITKICHPFVDKLYGSEDVDTKRIFMIMTIIVTYFLTAVGIVATMINLPGVLNPEFYALKELMQMVK
jgi:hypothetical protein